MPLYIDEVVMTGGNNKPDFARYGRRTERTDFPINGAKWRPPRRSVVKKGEGASADMGDWIIDEAEYPPN